MKVKHKKKEIVKAAKELIAKLEECSPHMTNALLMAQLHGVHYMGPMYTEEMDNLRRLIEEDE